MAPAVEGARPLVRGSTPLRSQKGYVVELEERRLRARKARFDLVEVVLGILKESDRPLQPNEIGRIAGLVVHGTEATEGARWTIVLGALDCLIAEGVVKKSKDGRGLYFATSTQ